MLSYQHGYHAGGPADVVKHAMLALVIARMKAKPTPLTYLETHAGRGIYPLAAPEMTKTAEYAAGFGKLWPKRKEAPSSLLPLLDVLAGINPRGEPTHYPGSPMVAAHMLGKGDAMHLCEAHPQEHAALQETMGGDARVHIYKTNGPRRVPTLITTQGERTLVLIDPSYEIKTEYVDTANTVKAILRKAPKAVVGGVVSHVARWSGEAVAASVRCFAG